jgi:glycine/D-amino acid oxidase-like deaminating enzyme
MIATEQLSPDSLGRLHSRDDFTVELNTAYVFYRVHNGRIVLGGIDRLKHKVSEFDVPSDIQQKLGKLLAASLAGLSVPKIAEAWAGRYHATHTELPIVKYAPGSKRIVHNVGYGGTGVALTQVLAPVAAALALGQRVADPDLARLHAAMDATRLPIVAGARAGTAIAWAAARNLIAR